MPPDDGDPHSDGESEFDAEDERASDRRRRELTDARELIESLERGDTAEAEEALRLLGRDIRAELFGTDSYTPVLLLVLSVVVLLPLVGDHVVGGAIVVGVSIVGLVLALQRSGVRSHWMRLLIALGVVAGGIALVSSVLHHSGVRHTALSAMASAGFLIVLGFTLPVILRRLLMSHRVTLNTLSGALAGYLMLGLFFTSLFKLLSILSGEPFFAQLSDPVTADFEYFSFITLTTVGYGDLTPASNVARAGAVCEAVLGQVFLVTIVARVVSVMAPRRGIDT